MVWTIDYTDTAKTQLRKLDKQAAQKLATEIAKNLGVKGYVTRYYP